MLLLVGVSLCGIIGIISAIIALYTFIISCKTYRLKLLSEDRELFERKIPYKYLDLCTPSDPNTFELNELLIEGYNVNVINKFCSQIVDLHKESRFKRKSIQKEFEELHRIASGINSYTTDLSSAIAIKIDPQEAYTNFKQINQDELRSLINTFKSFSKNLGL